ncbi:hypothetical protein HK103_000731 [Boothiomyces macroporosus]|uniref:Uncharacterized protein n=1 Tax=Boothiomyces macroporosus TaxID=261099 RepID=A0AAD5UBQ9_9FUNG|nr:hypothetical protein HK103_000731 [Boothiomyces macroporosus]
MNGDLYASVIKENISCIKLKKLSPRRTNTTITGLATLLSVINPTTIEYLDLEESEFGSEGAKVLARYPPELTIKKLGVKRCDVGAEYLAAALPNSNLKYLDISLNNLTGKGVILLLNSLNTRLRHLNVTTNKSLDIDKATIRKQVQKHPFMTIII